MEYISKDNVKCKAIMYKGSSYIKDFMQQISDNDMNDNIAETYTYKFTFDIDIHVMNVNKEIIKSISLRNNDYLVKVEDSSIGANGYLVIPKDVFEFIFKEKGDHNEI